MWSLNFLRFLKSSLILTEKHHQWIMKFNLYLSFKRMDRRNFVSKTSKELTNHKKYLRDFNWFHSAMFAQRKNMMSGYFLKTKPLLEKTVKYENLKKSLTLLDILFYRLRFLDRSTQIIDNVIWYKINLLTK